MEGRIIGIDPGSVCLGFGILDRVGKEIRFVSGGTCNAPKSWPPSRRFGKLCQQLQIVLRDSKSELLVMENSFHGKNAQSLLRLGEARGVVIAQAIQFDMRVQDYTPAEIKKAVTGKGNAQKETVARMMKYLIPGMPGNLPPDATDALAVAFCHFKKAHQQQLIEAAR